MTERPKIRIQRENEYRDLPLPRYATEHSAGMDLHAATRSEIVLQPGQRRLISAGIRIEIPLGYEGQVRPRSGLALKYGVTLLNTPGTIDSDYRGIIGVILINLGEEPFTIRRGDRIAQLVISPISQISLEEVEVLKSTLRGPGGFGSTGFTAPAKRKKGVQETTPDFQDDEYAKENDLTIPGGTDR
ncbi:dUTP diphosphatase [bacterium]|nr:dUTP diphosphatase [candidate division CSSED10-310 bacterium]